MTSAVTYVDEIVKDYLMYRGFIGTLKAFESDLKNDKDHGFRVDKIVEQFTNSISSYDLATIRETWQHLDKRIFSRCELGGANIAASKLEPAIYKMYVVNCISNNKSEKLMEFFEKMSSELQPNAEWKDWFALPFIKSPEEHPSFSMYFSKQWTETMLVSLHNFISISLHNMFVPALLAYTDEQTQIISLQEENKVLKQQLASSKQTSGMGVDRSKNESRTFGQTDLMDDFYVIAQEPLAAETHLKGIKSIIRNIGSGLPISPISVRRQTSSNAAPQLKSTGADCIDNSDSNTGQLGTPATIANEPNFTTASSKPNPTSSCQVVKGGDKKTFHQSGQGNATFKQTTTAGSTVSKQRTESKAQPMASSTVKTSSGALGHILSKTKTQSKVDKNKKIPSKNDEIINTFPNAEMDKSPFLLLSQEEFSDHHSTITNCRFNSSGTFVASSDSDGVIKIWTPNPVPKTAMTIVSRSSILSLEWTGKEDRMLLHGNNIGILRLFDTQEKRTIEEFVTTDSKSSIKDHSILCLASSPIRSSFVVSASNNKSLVKDKGKLMDCDLKTMKPIRLLRTRDSLPTTFNCCVFNHNGQLLVGGTDDGRITIFDVRSGGCIASWMSGDNVPVHTVQFSDDETTCYSLGSDRQFVQWSINNTGTELNRFKNSSAKDDVCNPRLSSALGGKLFSVNCERNIVLMCGQSGGLLKTMEGDHLSVVTDLGGHKSPVVSVDWSTAMDCGMCVTGSDDGQIRVSTLLAQ